MIPDTPPSIAFRIDAGAGIVVATCSGRLGLAVAKAGVSQFWKRVQWKGQPVVWDFRKAELDVAAAEVRTLAQFVLGNQPSPPPPRVAFVTARDVDFGLVRMFEAYREHPLTKVRTFRDYDEAVAWAASGETTDGQGT